MALRRLPLLTSPPFLRISSPNSKALNVHSQTSLLLPAPKGTISKKTVVLAGFPGLNSQPLRGFPQGSAVSPARRRLFGGLLFAVRNLPADLLHMALCSAGQSRTEDTPVHWCTACCGQALGCRGRAACTGRRPSSGLGLAEATGGRAAFPCSPRRGRLRGAWGRASFWPAVKSQKVSVG